MAVVIHHHHTIVSTPVCDRSSGRWKFNVSVSWPDIRNAHGVRFLRSSPELFSRFEDAEQAGLESGKNWVESRSRKEVAA